MKLRAAAALLWVAACTSRNNTLDVSAEDFAGQNLLFDKYMTDKCFNLVTSCNSVLECDQRVYTFHEGDRRMHNEGWAWEYWPPNLYVVEDHELDVHRSADMSNCWQVYLDASLLDRNAMACPCPYSPLIDRIPL